MLELAADSRRRNEMSGMRRSRVESSGDGYLPAEFADTADDVDDSELVEAQRSRRRTQAIAAAVSR